MAAPKVNREKSAKLAANSRKAKLEEERNYHLVTRKRRETGKFIKSFLRFAFSQVGMVVAVVLVATMGEDNTGVVYVRYFSRNEYS